MCSYFKKEGNIITDCYTKKNNTVKCFERDQTGHTGFFTLQKIDDDHRVKFASSALTAGKNIVDILSNKYIIGSGAT